MTEAKGHVVRVLVDAPGMDIIALWVATAETPMQVHQVILEALQGREMQVGAYATLEEVPQGEMLDFVLNPFKDWKPKGETE